MKIKAVLFLLILTVGITNAQKSSILSLKEFTPYHDFRIGIGTKPFEAAHAIENWYDWDWDEPFLPNSSIIDFNTKYYYTGPRYTTNAIFAEYIHQKNRWFGIGATVAYFSYFNNYFDIDTNIKIGRNIASHFSIYPTMRFSWINNPSFSLYSSIGLGARLVHESDKLNGENTNTYRGSISGQSTVIGMSFGKKIYGFTDISTVGTLGIFTVGVGYRLTSNK